MGKQQPKEEEEYEVEYINSHKLTGNKNVSTLWLQNKDCRSEKLKRKNFRKKNFYLKSNGKDILPMKILGSLVSQCKFFGFKQVIFYFIF